MAELGVDVNIDDHGTIAKAEKGLKTMAGAAVSATEKTVELSKEQKKLIADSKLLADAAKKTAVALASIKMVPFSSISLKGYTASIKEARIELER